MLVLITRVIGTFKGSSETGLPWVVEAHTFNPSTRRQRQVVSLVYRTTQRTPVGEKEEKIDSLCREAHAFVLST